MSLAVRARFVVNKSVGGVDVDSGVSHVHVSNSELVRGDIILWVFLSWIDVEPLSSSGSWGSPGVLNERSACVSVNAYTETDHHVVPAQFSIVLPEEGITETDVGVIFPVGWLKQQNTLVVGEILGVISSIVEVNDVGISWNREVVASHNEGERLPSALDLSAIKSAVRVPVLSGSVLHETGWELSFELIEGLVRNPDEGAHHE